jgi:hypothetical protein
MANRHTLLAMHANLSASMQAGMREERVSPRLKRASRAAYFEDEVLALFQKIDRSLEQYQEVNEGTDRAIRETLTDLARNVYGVDDMPMNDAGTSLIAD